MKRLPSRRVSRRVSRPMSGCLQVASAALALSGALAALPQRAAAFSDYELFGLGPLEGGGGSRWFTGSNADGYSCAVCHRGGVPPQVQILGLPEREFVPGQTYNIEVQWSAPDKLHALNLEFVTPRGAAAGLISLPEATALERADVCDPAKNEGMEGPAAHLIEESAPRQVLWLDDCGATRLRFRYTAPAAEPELMFALSMVQSDNSEKPEGDGVAALHRKMYASGLAPSASQCSMASGSLGSAAGSGSTLGLAGLAALLVRRRRRAR